MIKYTDKQKLEAVKAYWNGTGCLRATAEVLIPFEFGAIEKEFPAEI